MVDTQIMGIKGRVDIAEGGSVACGAPSISVLGARRSASSAQDPERHWTTGKGPGSGTGLSQLGEARPQATASGRGRTYWLRSSTGKLTVNPAVDCRGPG